MLAILIYISAIVAANISIATFGPSVSPINSFLFIGLDLALRDHLHEAWSGKYLWPRMLGLIAAAGAISFALNPATGMIAIASMVAFMAAAVIDSAVFGLLGGRSYLERSNGSNSVAAMADSLIFPAIAFSAWMPEIVAMQFAAKTLGGAAWAWLIYRAKFKFGTA